MTQLTPEYEELRRTTGASIPFLELMQERDRIRAEKDALRDGLIYLIGYHDAAGAVPLEKLRALLRQDNAPSNR